MTRENLQRNRLLVPGILIVLGAISLLAPRIDLNAKLKSLSLGDFTLPGFAVITAGSLYLIFDVRKFVGGDSWRAIDKNIEDRLLRLFGDGRRVTPDEVRNLRSEGRLLDVFYKVVDDDETLRSRMQGVYFNGLLVTSALDAFVLCLLFGIGHLVVGSLFREEIAHLLWGISLIVISLVVKMLVVPETLRTHRRLSDGQLNFVATFHATKVRELCETALQ